MDISLNDSAGSSEQLKGIRDIVAEYPGECQLFLRIRKGKSQTLIATSINIRPDNILLTRLEDMVGRGTVSFS